MTRKEFIIQSIIHSPLRENPVQSAEHMADQLESAGYFQGDVKVVKEIHDWLNKRHDSLLWLYQETNSSFYGAAIKELEMIRNYIEGLMEKETHQG